MEYAILPVTPFEQNCTLFWCTATSEAVVIDPGGEAERIARFLDDNALTLTAILLTHGHIDHVGGVGDLAALRPAPILGPHEADRYWIEGLPQQSEMFGLPMGRPFTPTQWLVEGDEIRFGEEKLEVLHCPGHTPGHVVFYHRASGLLQVGDVLFNGSVGRTDFPGGDARDLFASIRKKLFPLGDEVAFIAGHGPMSTLGEERRSNPYTNERSVY